MSRHFVTTRRALVLRSLRPRAKCECPHGRFCCFLPPITALLKVAVGLGLGCRGHCVKASGYYATHNDSVMDH